MLCNYLQNVVAITYIFVLQLSTFLFYNKHSWDNGCYYSDFRYVRETLYKKRTGEFFICGDGGAASCYAGSCDGNSTCYGEAIIPLSLQDAKEWVERKLDADTYVELFGEVEE